VITQIITAEEFWANHAAEYVKQKQAVAQAVGVSGKSIIVPARYSLDPDQSVYNRILAKQRRCTAHLLFYVFRTYYRRSVVYESSY